MIVCYNSPKLKQTLFIYIVKGAELKIKCKFYTGLMSSCQIQLIKYKYL